MENRFSNYTIVDLMSNAENCVDMLENAEIGKFQFQTTNFDPACFTDIMIPLNMELKVRGIQQIPMPKKTYIEVLEIKERDNSYRFSIKEFKQYVKCVETMKGNIPKWYKKVPIEKSVPELTTADKILR